MNEDLKLQRFITFIRFYTFVIWIVFSLSLYLYLLLLLSPFFLYLCFAICFFLSMPFKLLLSVIISTCLFVDVLVYSLVIPHKGANYWYNVCFLVSMLKFSCGCSIVGPYYFCYYFCFVSSFRSFYKLLISVWKMVVLV